MAKISRKTQKIFSNLNPTKLGVFGSAQLGVPNNSTDLDVLQNNAYERGWDESVIGGDKRPPLEEFNGIKYINDYQNAYLLQEGVPEYDLGTEYFIGSIVKDSGTSNLYKSITDNNTGNPLIDVVNWLLLGDLSALNNVVQATELNLGISEIATQTEVDLGIDDLKFLTPLKLQNKVSTETALGIISVATQSEVDLGINDTDAVTSLKLQAKIDSLDLGSKVLISTQTASADASIEFTGIDNTYDSYEVEIINAIPSNDDVEFSFRISQDNGVTFKLGVNDYSYYASGKSANNTNLEMKVVNADHIGLSSNAGGEGLGNDASGGFSANMKMFGLSNTTTVKNINMDASYVLTGGANDIAIFQLAGIYKADTLAIDAIQFFMSAGTISSGIFKLYGIK
jgi:hypothetical protein